MNNLRLALCLIMIIFLGSISHAQTEHKEFRTKKKISAIVAKVKSTDREDKKVRQLNKLVNRLNKGLEKMDVNNLSNGQIEEITHLRQEINNGFNMAKRGGNQQLDEFADFFESSLNQASEASKESYNSVIFPFLAVILILVFV